MQLGSANTLMNYTIPEENIYEFTVFAKKRLIFHHCKLTRCFGPDAQLLNLEMGCHHLLIISLRKPPALCFPLLLLFLSTGFPEGFPLPGVILSLVSKEDIW